MAEGSVEEDNSEMLGPTAPSIQQTHAPPNLNDIKDEVGSLSDLLNLKKNRLLSQTSIPKKLHESVKNHAIFKMNSKEKTHYFIFEQCTFLSCSKCSECFSKLRKWINNDIPEAEHSQIYTNNAYPF